ncbi:hypothetical protein [Actinomycetospora lemnae]|uniref:Uncharacterized protein n=1 Tax=Actinomycetospora lemnae TaxID=3019891 RepID=A0ABT5T058_9PSEU|nr:hypothetical protein [Actinomycetospora sp. DW7H6]MDD7967771.1 hypothetical protein [Actinomycetospora sp. DW7H6]
MRTTHPRTCSGPRWPAIAAAAATFVASVLLDLVGGASLGHVVALGSVSAVVGLLRLHRFGREHRVAAFLASATVLAQPALHAAGEVWDRTTADLTAAHSAVHLGLLVGYVVVAVAMVLLVAAVDVVLLACAEAVHRLARCLRSLISDAPEDSTSERPAVTRPARATVSLVWVAYAVRRGPPRLAVAD